MTQANPCVVAKSYNNCTPCDKPLPCQGGEKVRHLQKVPLCGIENCLIFGSHDAPFHDPKYPRNRTTPLKGFEGPIGLLICQSTVIKSETSVPTIQSIHFATILKAFAKIYLVPEKKWNKTTIIDILVEGEQLYKDSKMYEPDDEDDIKEIYTSAELAIKREFDTNGHVFHIELTDKFEIIPTFPLGKRPSQPKIIEEEEFYEEEEAAIEAVDELTIPDLPFSQFKRHIIAFFKKYKYCLMKFKNQYFLAWRAYGAYFFLDLNGRRQKDLQSDHGHGVATFICFKSLRDLIYLVKKCSNVMKDDFFNLREIKVVSLTTPEGHTITNDYGIRSFQFEIIGWDYAFLRTNLHLSLKRRDPLRYRSALPVAIAAILASKIDHPATWNKKMLDKIICFGVNFCRNCWINCVNNDDPIDLTQYPNELRMGQFWIIYQLTPVKYQGFWKCVSNYENNELWIAFKSAFENNDDKILLQIGSQMYSIWKKGIYYYIFDPYRHFIAGQQVEPNEDPKSATLRIFCTFHTFISVMNNILLQKTRTTRFYLHTIKIKQIVLMENFTQQQNYIFGDAGAGDDIVETNSINDNICFSDDLPKCAELGIISDMEEEEEDIPMSEYKEEELPGEEEEEADALGLDEGLESASTGDEYSSEINARRSKKKQKAKKKPFNYSDGKIYEKGASIAADAEEKIDAPAAKDERKIEGRRDLKDDTVTNYTDKSSKQTISRYADGEEKTKPEQHQNHATDEDLDQDKKKPKKPKPLPQVPPRPKPEVAKPAKKNKTFAGNFEARRRKLDDFDFDVKKIKTVCGQNDSDDENKANVCAHGAEKDVAGYGAIAHDMIVVGSESGTYESICGLLRSGFKCADRVLCMTPWGNYVVFRAWNFPQKIYFLFDGCTCNVNRFRYLDISCGTSGLVSFVTLHDVVTYMTDCQKMRTSIKENRERLVDDICRQYAV